MTDYKTGSGFHAAFDVVVELVLPGVDLCGTDVEAGSGFALFAEFSIDDDEGVRVFCETDRAEPFVKSQFFYV